MGKLRRNPDSERHIRRIVANTKDRGTTRGFQVHFSRDGRSWTKFFSDARCGSKEKARKAARKFRDDLEKSLPLPKSMAPIRDSATGFSLRVRKNRNGTVTQYISASAPDPTGKPVRKAFRIGEDMATAAKAALDWRLAMAMKRHRALKRQKG